VTEHEPSIPGAHRFALAIEYDGSSFNGWQRQSSPKIATVQETLENALSQVADTPVQTTCAGRTDSGVHATCQVVHFDSPIDRGSKAWVRGVNSLLPGSVRVVWAKTVTDEFHARFSATARRYTYIILRDKIASALCAGKITTIHYDLDIEGMQTGANYLLGEQDFSSFRAAGCQSRSPYREVFSARIGVRGKLCFLDIRANAFLQHMVRNIVGALLVVGRGDKSPDWIGQLLEARDRTMAGTAAPADGLYLMQVDYPAHFQLPETSRMPLILGE